MAERSDATLLLLLLLLLLLFKVLYDAVAVPSKQSRAQRGDVKLHSTSFITDYTTLYHITLTTATHDAHYYPHPHCHPFQLLAVAAVAVVVPSPNPVFYQWPPWYAPT